MTGRLSGRHVALIGAGHVAQEFARQAMAEGARVSATSRNPASAGMLTGAGISVMDISAGGLAPDALTGVTDLLISAPPGEGGCPALALVTAALTDAAPCWIGYLSSTAVYGDCGGDWIDETRPAAPQSADARGRLIAEAGWRRFAADRGAALDILRIAGIYGPGRNLLAMLRSGQARAIDKPGQVFNRIHRDDIASAAIAAMVHPASERLTNVADGNPCSSVELICGVARMLDLPSPQILAFDTADLPLGMAGFYAENRRLRNDRLLALPEFRLRYPDWRAGYQAIIAGESPI